MVWAEIFADGCVDFFDCDGLDELRVAVYVIDAEIVKLCVPERARQSAVGRERDLERADGPFIRRT